MRNEEQMKADLHRAQLLMEAKANPFSARTFRKGTPVVAGGRFGYWVSWDPLNNGKPWPRPVLVQFNGSDRTYYAVDRVRLATFSDYLFNPNGVGKTGLAAFALIALGCIAGTAYAVTEGDWTVWLFPGVFGVFVLGTWLNYTGRLK